MTRRAATIWFLVISVILVGCCLVAGGAANAAVKPSVLAFGASASAGYGASPGRTYTDDLNRMGYKVANSGVPGNKVEYDVYRFERNLGSSKVAIIWEGNDDIAGGAHGPAIEAAYQQMINYAHARGVKVIGATLQPAGWGSGTAKEHVRLAVNAWIRAKHFNAVADFDAVLRNPSSRNRLSPRYASGEGAAHPGNAGYSAIAQAAAPVIKKLTYVPPKKSPVRTLKKK